MLLSKILPSLLRDISLVSHRDLALACCILGAVSHVSYFRRKERDVQAVQFFYALFGIPLAILSLFYAVLHITFYESFELTAVIVGPYLASLYTSIVIYRLWFHPLSRFPGPFGLRVTHLYTAWVHWRSGQQSHRVSKEMHEKYGDIVRSGPNTLSIIDPSIAAVLGKADKGPWYVLAARAPNLQTVRDRKTHNIRRRVWDKAFTPEAISGYTPFVENHSNNLLRKLQDAAKTGQQLNLTAWMNYYTFDVMGDLSFGKPFGMLESGGKNDSDYFIHLTHGSMRLLGLLGKIPWLIYMFDTFGLGGKKHVNFLNWCNKMVEERKNMKTDRADIFSYLLAAEPFNKPPHHVGLPGEARLAIIAGSDTTASSLTTLFVYLADNQPELRKLQQIIDQIYESENCEGTTVPSRIVTGTPAIPFLEGCINEALRLHPPLPSGVSRIIPPEGIEVAGQTIPGNVNAYLPLYAALRDKRYFVDPDSFHPERWYESDERTLADMKAFFHPFWLGSFGCAGKELGLMQLRAVTAKLIRHFDFETAEGYGVEQALRCSLDTFTMEMGRVDFRFKQRKVAAAEVMLETDV